MDNMNKNNLISLTNKDVDRVVNLIHTTYRETYKSIIPENMIDLVLQEKYNKEIIEKNIENFIYVKDENTNELMGCLSIKILKFGDKRNIKIENFYVSKKYQGQGVGSLLFSEIKKLNIKKTTIFLNVRVDNPNAIKFYEKIGFYQICSDDMEIKISDYQIYKYLTYRMILQND